MRNQIQIYSARDLISDRRFALAQAFTSPRILPPPPMSSSPKTRPREPDETGQPCAKRAKVDDTDVDMTASTDSAVAVVNIADIEDQEDIDVDAKDDEPETLLPPSHALLNTKTPVYGSDGSMQQIVETDVGISEYIGFDVPKIEGIIKQRCAAVSCYPFGSFC